MLTVLKRSKHVCLWFAAWGLHHSFQLLKHLNLAKRLVPSLVTRSNPCTYSSCQEEEKMMQLASTKWNRNHLQLSVSVVCNSWALTDNDVPMQYSAHNVYSLKHEPIYAHLVKKVHFFYWPKTKLGCTTTGLKTINLVMQANWWHATCIQKKSEVICKKRKTCAGAPSTKSKRNPPELLWVMTIAFPPF